jgi:hypothetical protein
MFLKNKTGRFELDSTGSVYGSLAASCDNSNEPSGPIKEGEPDRLRNCYRHKKDSPPLNLLLMTVLRNRICINHSVLQNM